MIKLSELCQEFVKSKNMPMAWRDCKKKAKKIVLNEHTYSHEVDVPAKNDNLISLPHTITYALRHDTIGFSLIIICGCDNKSDMSVKGGY